MTTNQIQLTVDEILNKEFKKQVRGYNEADVDEFLDKVINDYDAFSKEIQRLQQENERLKRRQEHQVKEPPTQTGPNQVNYDVLKRLSNLEKAVFGRKRSEVEG